jgi:hypothetical protein
MSGYDNRISEDLLLGFKGGKAVHQNMVRMGVEGDDSKR